MWALRLILLAILILQVAAFAFFMARRKTSRAVLENRGINMVSVILYNLACYLLAALPSDESVFPAPAFLANAAVRAGFLAAGAMLILFGAVVFLAAVRRRKTVGGENVTEGLLTSGVYSFARHPIYAGIVSVSFGLALARGTWDGLLMVPLVWLVNAAEAKMEELVDIGVLFPAEYAEYRRQVAMFGPAVLWAPLLVFLAGLAGAGSL